MKREETQHVEWEVNEARFWGLPTISDELKIFQQWNFGLHLVPFCSEFDEKRDWKSGSSISIFHKQKFANVSLLSDFCERTRSDVYCIWDS